MPTFPVPFNAAARQSLSAGQSHSGQADHSQGVPESVSTAESAAGPSQPRILQTRAALETKIRSLLSAGEMFPDWVDRFGAPAGDPFIQNHPLDQVRRFQSSPDFVELRDSLQNSVYEPVFRFLLQQTSFTTPLLPADFQMAWDRFMGTYFPSQNNVGGSGSIGTSFRQLYQNACLNLHVLGAVADHLASATAQAGDGDFEWRRQAATRLHQTLKELFETNGGFSACTPGLVTHLGDAVAVLRQTLFPPRLHQRYLDKCDAVFDQTLLRLLRESFSQSPMPGQELHFINAWRQAYGEQLGVSRRPHDVLSSAALLGDPATQQMVIATLKRMLRPGNVLPLLADDCKAMFSEALIHDDSGAVAPDAWDIAYRKVCDAWGVIPRSYLMDFLPETGMQVVRKQTDLLVAWIGLNLLHEPDTPAPTKDQLAQAVYPPVPLRSPFNPDGTLVDDVALQDFWSGNFQAVQATRTPALYCMFGMGVTPGTFNLHAWQEVRSIRGENRELMIERDLVSLDDFSPELLAFVYRSLLQGGAPTFNLMAHRLLWAFTEVFRNADNQTRHAFAGHAFAKQMGIDRLAEIAGFCDPKTFRMSLPLILGLNHPFTRSLIRNLPSQPDEILRMQDRLRTVLRIRAHCQDKLPFLTHLIVSGHCDLNRPLYTTAARSMRQDDPELQQTLRLIDGPSFAGSDLWYTPLSIAVTSPNWNISKEQAANLIDAMLDSRHLMPSLAWNVDDFGHPRPLLDYWMHCTDRVSDAHIVRLIEMNAFRDWNLFNAHEGNLICMSVTLGRLDLLDYLLELKLPGGEKVFSPGEVWIEVAPGQLEYVSPLVLALQRRSPRAFSRLLQEGADLRGFTIPQGLSGEALRHHWKFELMQQIPPATTEAEHREIQDLLAILDDCELLGPPSPPLERRAALRQSEMSDAG